MEYIHHGAEKCKRRSLKSNAKSRRGKAQLLVRYRLADDPPTKTREAVGRFGWALLRLHRAGAAGITSLDNPAPRLSHYVYGLRRDGVQISTEYEDHGGAFAGKHGRYRLIEPVSIVAVIDGGDQ
jgi:hypothetical protein